MKLNLFGLSGGKDSSALALWALFRSGYPNDSLRFTFCDTGNEHAWTYEHVRKLDSLIRGEGGGGVEWLKPELGFYELALQRQRFPSVRARFCTQELKIFPTQDYVNKLLAEGHELLAHSGVRAEESEQRAALPERDLNGMLLIPEYRPLLRWTLADVLAIHREHNFPLNPLYAAGAKRVGCFPCIMSRKSEILNCALKWPERISAIAECEREFFARYGRYSTFFANDKTPLRFRKHTFAAKDGRQFQVATIEDVVEWSKTVGMHCEARYDDPALFDLEDEAKLSCESGFCE